MWKNFTKQEGGDLAWELDLRPISAKKGTLLFKLSTSFLSGSDDDDDEWWSKKFL